MLEIIRMLFVLTAICVASGASLSALKGFTQPYIEAQILSKLQGPALELLFAGIQDNNSINDRKNIELADGNSITVYPAYHNKSLIGVAIEQESPGYGGDLGVMVGIDVTKDSLIGTQTTIFKETPGYGSKTRDEPFKKQFVGVPFDVNFKSDGGRIDLITGATVSSYAYMESVQNAIAIYIENKDAILAELQKAESIL
ncbi:MAG: FMN-binding protein [Desulfovibrionaceae bacterium]